MTWASTGWSPSSFQMIHYTNHTIIGSSLSAASEHHQVHKARADLETGRGGRLPGTLDLHELNLHAVVIFRAWRRGPPDLTTSALRIFSRDVGSGGPGGGWGGVGVDRGDQLLFRVITTPLQAHASTTRTTPTSALRCLGWWSARARMGRRTARPLAMGKPGADLCLEKKKKTNCKR
jgi:hypothetical protein